jgi:flagellar biosynthesis/type III secretory pathway protein FliH
MPRGGAREGAGRESAWNNGKTKTIRVPEALADRVLKYARQLNSEGDNIKTIQVPKALVDRVLEHVKQLESGQLENDAKPVLEIVTETKTLDLSGVRVATYNGKLVVYLEDLAKAGFDIFSERLGQIFKSILSKR